MGKDWKNYEEDEPPRTPRNYQDEERRKKKTAPPDPDFMRRDTTSPFDFAKHVPAATNSDDDSYDDGTPSTPLEGMARGAKKVLKRAISGSSSIDVSPEDNTEGKRPGMGDRLARSSMAVLGVEKLRGKMRSLSLGKKNRSDDSFVVQAVRRVSDGVLITVPQPPTPQPEPEPRTQTTQQSKGKGKGKGKEKDTTSSSFVLHSFRPATDDEFFDGLYPPEKEKEKQQKVAETTETTENADNTNTDTEKDESSFVLNSVRRVTDHTVLCMAHSMHPEWARWIDQASAAHPAPREVVDLQYPPPPPPPPQPQPSSIPALLSPHSVVTPAGRIPPQHPDGGMLPTDYFSYRGNDGGGGSGTSSILMNADGKKKKKNNGGIRQVSFHLPDDDDDDYYCY